MDKSEEATYSTGDPQGFDSERQYLRQGFLYAFSLAILCLGWLWGAALIIQGIPSFSSPYWIAPFSLITLGALGVLWHEKHLPLATGAVLLATWLAPTVTAYASGNAQFLFGYVFVLIGAGVLAGPLITTLLAALSIGFAFAAERLLGLPHPATAPVSLLVVLTLGLSWLLCKHIYLALEWSWNSQQRTLREMLIARERRAELRRAVKALNEQYERLARLNLELFQARREAEEARKLKAEFAANVSHELRTPINLIVGFSEMMYTAPESYGGQVLPAEYMGDVHAIYRSARHLQSLIDDILDLSRIDAKYMGLTRELTDLGAVITEAAETVKDWVATKGLELQIEIAPNLPAVYIDRTRIRQVLLNLFSNAIRFTDTGFIRVTCALSSQTPDPASSPQPPAEQPLFGPADQIPPSPPARHIRVQVSDSGIGIKPAALANVFEEFRQMDGSSKRKHGGTGLGLAISKRFVELHGGWMWAESQVGQGSTFSFLLAVADEPWARPGLIEEPRAVLRQPVERTIVVMDQEPAVIQMFRRYIQAWRVEGATDLPQAVRLINELHPDVLVLGSPGNGQDLPALQASYPELAEARLTVLSCTVPSDYARALALGLTDYLVKPVTQRRFHEALRRLPSPAQTVLAVEDDPNMMRLLGRMLASFKEQIPIQFTRAYSAEEALTLLRAQTPDLILLDLGLPGMSGYELLRRIQADEAWRDIPVIVVTANTQWEAGAAQPSTVTLTREEGFSAREILALAEIVADKFPCQYAPVIPGQTRGPS